MYATIERRSLTGATLFYLGECAYYFEGRQQIFSAFETLWKRLFDELLVGDEHYALRQDLERARYRFIDEDPWAMTKPERFRIRCQHNPEKFAQLIGELLNPAELEKRRELVRRAKSAGAGSEGLTNAEIAAAIGRCLDADMRAFDELSERDELDRMEGGR